MDHYKKYVKIHRFGGSKSVEKLKKKLPHIWTQSGRKGIAILDV